MLTGCRFNRLDDALCANCASPIARLAQSLCQKFPVGPQHGRPAPGIYWIFNGLHRLARLARPKL